MSIDERSGPFNAALLEWQRYERDQAAGSMLEKLDRKINTLINKRPSHPNTPDAMVEIFISIMREKQMSVLGLHTVEISTNEIEEGYIDLSESFFKNIELPFPPEFREHTNDFMNAAQRGELMGLEDFLEVLVPSEVHDPNKRAVYFSAWKRELLEKLLGALEENADGSACTILQTDIPNIGVSYYYPPLRNIPERAICLYQP